MSDQQAAPLEQQISELKREYGIADKNLSRQVEKRGLHPEVRGAILWRLRSAIWTLEKVQRGELIPCITKTGEHTL